MQYVLCKFEGDRLIKRSHAIPTLEAAQELLLNAGYDEIRVLDDGIIMRLVTDADRTTPSPLDF
jgi:hypothetical protein